MSLIEMLSNLKRTKNTTQERSINSYLALLIGPGLAADPADEAGRVGQLHVGHHTVYALSSAMNW